jgi:hypothetical protein
MAVLEARMPLPGGLDDVVKGLDPYSFRTPLILASEGERRGILTLPQRRVLNAVRAVYGWVDGLENDEVSSDPGRCKRWRVERFEKTKAVGLHSVEDAPGMRIPITLGISDFRASEDPLDAGLKAAIISGDGNRDIWFRGYADHWLPRVRPNPFDPGGNPPPLGLAGDYRNDEVFRRAERLAEAGSLDVIPLWELGFDRELTRVMWVRVKAVALGVPHLLGGKPFTPPGAGERWPGGDYGYEVLYHREGEFRDITVRHQGRR